MKKVLTLLSALMLTSTAAINTVSCEAPTDGMDVYVGGKKEYKLKWRGEDKDIRATELFSNGNNKLMTNLTIQLLEALTYKDSKYQNIEKRTKEQKFLGESGLGLSLDYILNDSYTSKKAKINFDNDSTKDEFIEDYTRSSKNTRFKSLDYKINSIKLDDKNLSAEYGNSNTKITTFNGNNSFGVTLENDYNEKAELDKSEVTSDSNVTKQNLSDFYDLNWSTYYPELFENDSFGYFSEYKDKLAFAMSSEEADNFYDKLLNNVTTESQNLIKGVNKTTFSLIHKQLVDSKDKVEIGFLMPSDFLLKKADKGERAISEYSEDAYDISKGAKLFRVKDKKEIGSQNDKENEGKTFVYSKALNAPSISLDFVVPSDNGDEKSYTVNIDGLNNMVVGLTLSNFKISEKKDESNGSARKDLVYYWYEPTIYQFSDKKFFKIGEENMFESLDIEKVNINVTKK
ncbi:hypothetical protein SCORR_v1c00250 [Spiroplasma corruscae]|uniref:Lipoprotein n=1 Tax=Spiroplasma corruscae TaxID=216934 RepID=A0A222EMP7_9MOLU|nr:hypothetical protein [Spiroplasma corruscae]ASP27800.1 hypothetical protein SCORR_v1c00250 [Spiroplasma corruscae]